MKEIRKHYHEAIAEIDREVLKMGAHVEESVGKAMSALVNQDTALAEQVIAGDEVINRFEQQIQDRLTVLIATEQPVAGELRHIITSLKVISQVERMGDHSVHIAKAAVKMVQEKFIKSLIDLPKMAEYGMKMVHEVLTAFSERDKEKAISVAQLDDRIDELHNQVWRELLTYMMADVSTINQATTLLFVSRWLERFGDHATNISEWVVYDSTGEHIELNL